MSNGSKFFWELDASGSEVNLDEGAPLSNVGTITITETAQWTYYTDSTDSLLYDVEDQMNTLSGGNTYSFEPVKAINDTFGRRDARLQIRATQGATDADFFELNTDRGVLDYLGAIETSTISSYAETSTNASGGIDQLLTLPNRYRGSWTVPPIYRRDNRRTPYQVASSARSQNGLIATRVREELSYRPMYFNAVPADLIYSDRLGEGISGANIIYATLENMWDEALRLGKEVRLFVDEPTDELDVSGAFYKALTVGRRQRDDMRELVEELNDVMGGAHYNVRIDAVIHSRFNLP